jgi:hypothetical protein
MKKILFAASALTLLAVAPASAQMMGGMMGPSGQSCVSGGQFVPCPGPGMQAGMMQPGMAMQDPGMEPQHRMTRREMREQRRMMREQQQGM